MTPRMELGMPASPGRLKTPEIAIPVRSDDRAVLPANNLQPFQAGEINACPAEPLNFLPSDCVMNSTTSVNYTTVFERFLNGKG